jgi:hypothetical protein
LRYLDAESSRQGPDSRDRSPLRALIADSDLRRYLRRCGYRGVSFPGGYDVTDVRDADHYLGPTPRLNEFDHGLLNLTPIPLIADRLCPGFQYAQHRATVLNILDRLPETCDLPGPVFVFAYVFCPHSPFVFGPAGEPVQPDRPFSTADYVGKWGMTGQEYVEGYRAHVRFINGRIIPVIDAILKKSATPPVIILAGDHGPSATANLTPSQDTRSPALKEKFAILNAVRLPGGGHDRLYAGVSPVNTFRVVVNHCFGASLEMLKDESYFSYFDRPYDFKNVTDVVR